MSTQEKRRLERLKKELDNQQKKLDADKRKYQRQLKELKADQSKLSSQKRELNTAQKKFALLQKQLKQRKNTSTSSTKSQSSFICNKLKEEIKHLKSVLNTTKKDLRETRKTCDALMDEMKILRRKLKKAGNILPSSFDERKYKQAKREIFNMKRRLKIAIRDMDKQAKYYESQLRRFKLDELKWINRQREINKDKNIIIKYVFIDDIRTIKLYNNTIRNKIRVKTCDGAEIIIHDIDILDVTDKDIIADNVLDNLIKEIQADLTRKKRKYDKIKIKKNVSVGVGDDKTPKTKTKTKKSKSKTSVSNTDNDGNNVSVSDNDYGGSMGSGSDSMDDIDNDMKSLDDVFNLDDDGGDDYIDACFNSLMTELNCRTRDLHKININQDIENLLNNVKLRHNEMEKKLNELNYDYVDELPEMNVNWQNEILKLIDIHNNNPHSDVLNKQLIDRMNVFSKVISVLNNDQPKALLDELINDCSDDDDQMKSMLNEFNKIKIKLMNDNKMVNSNPKQSSLCNELINEMVSRHKDMNSMRQLSASDMEPFEEIENILDEVKKRHIRQQEKLLNNDDKDDGDDDKLFDDIRDNNVTWQDDLKKTSIEFLEAIKNTKINQYSSDELNGRIADLLKLMDIYNKTKSTAPDLKDIKNRFDSFVIGIKDRHAGNMDNISNNNDICDNDKDWRDNIFSLVASITGLKVKNVSINGNINDNNDVDNDNKNGDNDDVFDPNDWWLDKDDNRKITVDDIKCDDQQEFELYEAAMYLDRLLYINNDNKDNKDDDDDDDNDIITSLYLPIPQIYDDNKINKHNIIASLYDGVLLCKLINKVHKNEYIDTRCIFLPNAFNPFPISDDNVRSNTQLIISCAKSMGIQLSTYDINEWLDSANWSQLTIDLINGLSTKYLNSKINLHKSKELVRLVKNNEDPHDIRKLTGQQWLQRWINYKNSKPVLDDINGDQFNNELYSSMKLVDDNDDNNNIDDYADNPQQASVLMINANKKTNVQADDLQNNNRKLQDLFAADLFRIESGLDKLSASEKTEYKSLLKSSSRNKSDYDTYTDWINTALAPNNIKIINILKDLSSGYILCKILDKAKPGCIQWRNVRKKIRHKYDKLNNCNIVMKICETKLNLSLVGMAGSDIVDSNEKFLHSLLSQLMRYYSTRQLSMLLFKNATNKNKVVTDEDILQWVNLKINECDDAHSKPITSFKDRVLSSCIFYIELLKAVKPNDVNLNLCNYDVKALVNSKVVDKQKTLRMQNARYVMTLIRRMGGELFVIPHHLCIMENKAILAVFAAIMTISITGN